MIPILRNIKINKGVGPDSLPQVLRHGAGALKDAFASLINSAISSSSIPGCWRLVINIFIPISNSYTALTNRFIPNALKSPGSKRSGRGIVKCLHPSLYLDDPIQFAYKSNKSNLDSVTFLIHHTCESLFASIKFDWRFSKLFVDIHIIMAV